MKGRVYLIGAGCGDFDLITIRGLKLLQSCDTVIYDSLIDKRLLSFAPENAEKICVGKRAGHHSETQENINKILADKALEGKTVVRLKGGDPFVFGRGGEEVLSLRERDIPYSIVPGITSAVAVPELAGISVTHRCLSRSFHVITGHTADTLVPEKLHSYALLDGTLVFLMGLTNLREIADGLMAGGMRKETPAAVISCGGTSKQRVVTDSLAGIADTAEREKLSAPAVIVVGETARLDFSPTVDLPLRGVSVTVTGTQRFTAKLSGQLSELGADVNVLDLLKVTEYIDNPAMDDAVENIDSYSWLVLTSVNGAEIFLKRLRRMKKDLRQLASLKLGVIGSGTAKYLEERGIFPELVPECYTSAALGEALSRAVGTEERVLILRAEKGSPELTEVLDRHNIIYDDIRIYDVEKSCENSESTVIDTDFLTFASSSGADAFFDGGFTVSPETRIVCIGDITAKALIKLGAGGFLTASVQNAEGIADVILQEVQK